MSVQIFKALLNGLQQRGPNGVLYVCGDMCGYMLPHEFPDKSFCIAIEQMLLAEGTDNFFVVEERDANLHVFAYPKSRVWADVVADAKRERNETSGQGAADCDDTQQGESAS